MIIPLSGPSVPLTPAASHVDWLFSVPNPSRA